MILFILVCLTSLVVFYEDEEPYDEEIFIKKCI